MDTDVLKRLQHTELEILIEVDRICKKHHIAYQLNSGTLLGAVRHKGFIPWDDDIDIVMPLKDYYRFCRVCRKELDSRYFLQTFLTDHFHHFYAKVRKNGTIMRESENSSLLNEGIWIDIFPIVGVKASEQWIDKKNKKIKRYKSLLKKINSTAPWKELSVEKKILRVFPRRFLKGIVSLKSKRIYRPHDRFDVCCYVWGEDYLRERFPSDLFDETCEVEFEGRQFPAPKQYDKYLTIEYGDYMTPPPPEKRNGGAHTVIMVDFGE